MSPTIHFGGSASRRLALLVAAALLVVSAFAVAAPVLATGNSISVSPATTTISPTGSTFTVNVTGNGSVAISAAGAALSFDKSRLQVTAIAKDATEVANGVAYGGWPTGGANGMTAFIAAANASGTIPTISWFYVDGSSNETAGAEHGIFSATFQVIGCGNVTVTPVIVPNIGGMNDGTSATYGAPLTNITLSSAAVVNPCPSPSPSPSPSASPSPSPSPSASPSPSPSPGPSASPSPGPTQPNTLWVSPASSTGIAIGTTFSVNVLENAPIPTSGVQATLTFDKNLMQITSVTPGNLWGQSDVFIGTAGSFATAQGTAKNIAAANGSGSLKQLAAFYVPPQYVDTGTQTFLTVTFQAIACGHSNLGLPVGPADADMIDGRPNIDANNIVFGNEIPVSTTGGSVDICAGPSPSPSPSPSPTPTVTPPPLPSGGAAATNWLWVDPSIQPVEGHRDPVTGVWVTDKVVVGTSRTFQIWEHSSVDIAGVQATLAFDYTVLQITSVTFGPAFASAPIKAPSASRMSQFISAANTTGWLSGISANMLQPDNIPAGDNLFLTVTFTPIVCGRPSDLDLPTLVYDALMSDGRLASYGTVLPLSTVGGIVQAADCAPGQTPLTLTPPPPPPPITNTRVVYVYVTPAAVANPDATTAPELAVAAETGTPPPTPKQLAPVSKAPHSPAPVASSSSGGDDSTTIFLLLMMIPLYSAIGAVWFIRRYGVKGLIRG